MSDVTDTAARFVGQIVAGNTGAAHEILSDRLAGDVAASDLLTHFEALAEDMGGVTGVGEPMVILEAWPDKSEDDRAMVYVPLEGDEFSEAITVTVSEQNGELRISSIEWGRP